MIVPIVLNIPKIWPYVSIKTIIFLSFNNDAIELLNSSGFTNTSSAAADGGVSGLFLKKRRAKSNNVPVMIA